MWVRIGARLVPARSAAAPAEHHGRSWVARARARAETSARRRRYGEEALVLGEGDGRRRHHACRDRDARRRIARVALGTAAQVFAAESGGRRRREVAPIGARARAAHRRERSAARRRRKHVARTRAASRRGREVSKRLEQPREAAPGASHAAFVVVVQTATAPTLLLLHVLLMVALLVLVVIHIKLEPAVELTPFTATRCSSERGRIVRGTRELLFAHEALRGEHHTLELALLLRHPRERPAEQRANLRERQPGSGSLLQHHRAHLE
mmetsp:Transcript_16411/g.53602  ORF Transcript_16411/g.53602 Transcript_16411/m.53602 type:complete len:267 (+) Transcript_16411:951-1751(+)